MKRKEMGDIAKGFGALVVLCLTWGTLISVSCGDQKRWDKHICEYTTERLESLPRGMVLDGMVACRIVGEPGKSEAIRKYLKGGRKL